MATDKTTVIEHIFDGVWDDSSSTLTRSVITLEDVGAAIQYCNVHRGTSLSTNNPANFFKDFIRGSGSSRNWPARISSLEITARQVTGEGNVFEFVPFESGQTEAFPDKFIPDESTPCIKIQALSIPRYARELGREDESWLVQTVVNLKVIENHFAVTSQVDVVEITHLQMSVKLRRTEIDALFLAFYQDGEETKRAIITCEAKQKKDPIILDQIIKQVQAAFGETDVDLVLPVGLRAIRGRGLFVVEFEPVARSDADSLDQLTVSSSAIYELNPPIKGLI